MELPWRDAKGWGGTGLLGVEIGVKSKIAITHAGEKATHSGI